MDKEKTGQLITELRKEKGMTQKQLADALNVTDKAVSKWERGLSFPDISMLEPLSELLDVSIMELLAGKRQDGDEPMSREEAQDLINASVELGDEEIRHKKERSRLIIIILLVFVLLFSPFCFGDNLTSVEYPQLFQNRDPRSHIGSFQILIIIIISGDMRPDYA